MTSLRSTNRKLILGAQCKAKNVGCLQFGHRSTVGISIVITIIFFLFTPFSYGSDDLPEPGGTCTEPDATYNYSTDPVKTPWKLAELYAVPVGTIDPAEWALSSYFKTQFDEELGTGESPLAFAQACTAVWLDYFTADAAVVITVERTITITHKTLRCDSGNWATLSTEEVQVDDVSDWLTANGSPFDVNGSNSTALLEADLQSILTNLNGQPGSE